MEPSRTTSCKCNLSLLIERVGGFFHIISDDSSPENFETFLETVNKNLKPLYMEIRRGVSEEDGSNNYGLVWEIWNVKLIRKKSGFQNDLSHVT